MNFYKSLKGKMVLTSIVTLIGFIAYLAIVFQGNSKLGHELNDAHKILIPDIVTYEELLLNRMSIGYFSLQEISSGSDPKTREKSHKKLIEAWEKMQIAYKNSAESIGIEGQKEIQSKIDEDFIKFKKSTENIFELLNKNNAGSDQEVMDQITTGDWQKVAMKLRLDISELLAMYKKTSVERNLKQIELREEIKKKLIIMFFVIGILNLGILYLLSHRIAKNIDQIAQKLQSSADKVLGTSNETANVSTTLSSSVNEQAAAIQETTASVEETSAMINRNTENAKESADRSKECHHAVIRGQDAIKVMTKSISEISDSNEDILKQIEESNREMTEIINVISEIANKTKVINDIVFQTKLLSFNASVEAARAGEQGKGFAVVAEEVGNLAQMSGNSAKEITDMLNSSMQKVESIAKNTKAKVDQLIVKSREKVGNGVETTKRCNEAFLDVITNVEKVNHLVSEIATASEEQSRGVEEINRAMGELDSVAAQNNQISQKVSVYASELKHEVDDIQDMIKELNKSVAG